MKVLSVIGTRPEAIKMAPVVRELQRRATGGLAIQSVLCVTAQHREMLDQMLAQFDLHPDYDLGLMQENQTLSLLTAKALTCLEPVLIREQPDWVLVQGDTTTAMAAALAAFYHRIRIGHVEAGLRTHDKYQPFPEEINRLVIDRMADAHFAPTESTRQNLLAEGVPAAGIHVTGNPVIDALQWAARLPFDLAGFGIPALCDPEVRVVLVTAHRRENFGAPLENICAALAALAERYQGRVLVVYPVHRNPNVREPVERLIGRAPHVALLPPLDYSALVHLIRRAHLVLTDSGGIQEEAPSLGKPVLVLRDVTERPEAVHAGTVQVVGTGAAEILAAATRLLENAAAYAQMARAVNPYGDGHAAERIVEALIV